MATSVSTPRPRATLAALAALALGLASAAPAGAATLDGGAALHLRAHGLHHARPRAGTWRARRFAHRRWRGPVGFAAAPAPRIGATGLPAGYASDESPFNVQAEDDEFDTGAFYGCLHNVLTAGGYRPVATCD